MTNPLHRIRTVALLACWLGVSGCATSVIVPPPLGAAPITEKAAAVDPPLTVSGAETITLADAPDHVWLPEEGTPTDIGPVTTAALARAYHARLAGDDAASLAAVEQALAELHADSDVTTRWFVTKAVVRTRVEQGMPEAAQALLGEVTRLELEAFGSDLVAAVIKGDLRVWARDFDGARD